MNDDLIFLVQRSIDSRVELKRSPVRNSFIMSSLDIADQHDAIIAAGRLTVDEQIDVLLDAVSMLSSDYDIDKSASINGYIKSLRRAVRLEVAV